MLKINPASPVGFGNCTHEDKWYIITDKLIKCYIQSLTKFEHGKKQDKPREYMKGVSSFPTTWGYQYWGNYLSYKTREIFAQIIFYFLVMHY